MRGADGRGRSSRREGRSLGLRQPQPPGKGCGARRVGHVVGVSRGGRGGTAGRAAPLEASGDGGAGNGARTGRGCGGIGWRPEEGLRIRYEAAVASEPLRAAGRLSAAEFRLPRLPEPFLGS